MTPEKKQLLRLTAAFGVLMFLIVSLVVFSTLKNYALAYLNSYSKNTGDLVTKDMWNNLDDDFGNNGWNHVNQRVYTGSTPAEDMPKRSGDYTSSVWQDLDLSAHTGKQRVMVTLKISLTNKGTGNSSFSITARANGDTSNYGPPINSNNDCGAYDGDSCTLSLETSDQGVIEWKSTGGWVSFAQDTVDIHVVGFIK